MFEKDDIRLFDQKHQDIGKTTGSVQPYSKVIAFEGGIELLVTARVFCEMNSVQLPAYLLSKEQLYRVIDYKKWVSYYELYLCESDVK